MRSPGRVASDCAIGLVALAAIVAVGHAAMGGMRLTGTALMMLLPVLWVASRTDALLGTGMALVAAVALNFFLLPPL